MQLQIRIPFTVEFMLSSKLFRILTLAREYLMSCAHQGLRQKDPADRRIEAAKAAAVPLGQVEVDFLCGSAALALCVVSRKIELMLAQLNPVDEGMPPDRASAISAFLQQMALLSPGARLDDDQLGMALTAADFIRDYEQERARRGPTITHRYVPVHEGVRSVAMAAT